MEYGEGASVHPLGSSSEKFKMSYSGIMMVTATNKTAGVVLKILISERSLHPDCPVKFAKRHFRTPSPKQISAYNPDGNEYSLLVSRDSLSFDRRRMCCHISLPCAFAWTDFPHLLTHHYTSVNVQ